MAFTQADLEAIEASIKSGKRDVQYQDRKVTYRSLDELFKIRDFISGILSGGSQFSSSGGRIFQGSRSGKGGQAGRRPSGVTGGTLG